MSVESVRHRIPFTVPVGAGTVNTVLESSLSVEQVLLPQLLFINSHPTIPVTLTIVRRVNLGVSADPEDDGVINTTVVSAQVIAANGGQYQYTPPLNLIVDSDTPSVQHLITLTHADLALTPIVQLIVGGISETSVRTSLFNFTRS